MRHSVRAALDPVDPFANKMGWSIDFHHRLLRELRSSYAEKRAIFDKLVKESAIYDEMVQLAELGFYKPHFDFDASEEYKNLIGDVRGAQKKMLTEKTAIFSSKEWVLDGSKAKGKTMMNRGIRLTARAFNNECEAAVSNVSWNNVQRMEQRIGVTGYRVNTSIPHISPCTFFGNLA